MEMLEDIMMIAGLLLFTTVIIDFFRLVFLSVYNRLCYKPNRFGDRLLSRYYTVLGIFVGLCMIALSIGGGITAVFVVIDGISERKFSFENFGKNILFLISALLLGYFVHIIMHLDSNLNNVIKYIKKRFRSQKPENDQEN